MPVPSGAPRSMAHPATTNDDATSPASGASMFILMSDAFGWRGCSTTSTAMLLRLADGRAGPSRRSHTASQAPASRTDNPRAVSEALAMSGSAHPRPADGRAGPSRRSHTPSQAPASRTDNPRAVSEALAMSGSAHHRLADGRVGPSRRSHTPSQAPASRTDNPRAVSEALAMSGSAHPRPADGRAGPSRRSHTPSQAPASRTDNPRAVSEALAMSGSAHPRPADGRVGPSRRSHTPNQLPASRTDNPRAVSEALAVSGSAHPGQRMVGRDPAAVHTHPVRRRLHGGTFSCSSSRDAHDAPGRAVDDIQLSSTINAERTDGPTANPVGVVHDVSNSRFSTGGDVQPE